MAQYNGYIVRKVNGDDINELSEILVKSFNMSNPNTPWDFDHAKAYMLYWLEKEPNLFYGAFIGNTPIAARAVNIKPWRTSVRVDEDFYVKNPDVYIKGSSSALLKTVLLEAKQKYGATALEVVALTDDKDHIKWLKSMGIKRDKGSVPMKGEIDEILKHLES